MNVVSQFIDCVKKPMIVGQEAGEAVNYYMVFPRNSAKWGEGAYLSVFVARNQPKEEAQAYMDHMADNNLRTQYRYLPEENFLPMDDFGLDSEDVIDWAELAVEVTPQAQHSLPYLLEVFSDFCIKMIRRMNRTMYEA